MPLDISSIARSIGTAKSDVSAEEDTPQRREARSRLLTVLEQALRLLHPFMPYITEDLWQRLPGGKQLHPSYEGAEPTIMLAAYPEGGPVDEVAETEMSMVIALISAVRNIRSELNVNPSERISVLVGMSDAKLRDAFERNVNQIKRLTRASEVVISEKLEAPKASAKGVLSNNGEVAVPLAGLIDFAEETNRLKRKREKLENEATKLQTQLANPDFAQRAPAEKVQQTQNRISEVQLNLKTLDQLIENLQ